MSIWSEAWTFAESFTFFPFIRISVTQLFSLDLFIPFGRDAMNLSRRIEPSKSAGTFSLKKGIILSPPEFHLLKNSKIHPENVYFHLLMTAQKNLYHDFYQ